MRVVPVSALVLGLLVLPACGSGGSDAAGSSSSGDPTAAVALVVVRTGGLAGVHDRLRIAPDGSAQLTSRTGGQRSCTPHADDVRRLRGLDLAAVATEPTHPPRVADGFGYSVTRDGRTAAGNEGDGGRRAELVDAAAAVMSSCLADLSGGS